MFVSEASRRIALSGAYSSDSHQARAASASGNSMTTMRAHRRVQFVIYNPGSRDGDEHPYARELGTSLRRAKVPVVMYRVP